MARPLNKNQGYCSLFAHKVGRKTNKVRLKDFATTTVWKPFLIALCLMFFFQFSGINVILQYTVDIFQSADSSVKEFQVSSGLL